MWPRSGQFGLHLHSCHAFSSGMALTHSHILTGMPSLTPSHTQPGKNLGVYGFYCIHDAKREAFLLYRALGSGLIFLLSFIFKDKTERTSKPEEPFFKREVQLLQVQGVLVLTDELAGWGSKDCKQRAWRGTSPQPSA